MNRRMAAFCLVVSTVYLTSFIQLGVADEPKLVLGAKGPLLFEEKFDQESLAKGWNLNTGSLKVETGVLRAFEKSSDNHAGAFRYPLPLQDFAVQMDFKFDSGSKFLHLGFDPAPGQIKKKGHLFSVSVAPTGWSLIEHPNKDDPKSKNNVLASSKDSSEPGKWYTLLMECKGDSVAAHIAGRESLRGTSSDFHVKKPGLVLRMGGPDDQAVSFDNFKVWELK